MAGKPRIVVAAALLLALSGCATDEVGDTAAEEDRQVSEPAAEAEGDSPEDGPEDDEPDQEDVEGDAIEIYFTALSSRAVDDILVAQEASEPDSPADLYAEYFAEATRAGFGGDASFREVDGGADLCSDNGCTEYRDFRLNDDGEIVTFSVDGQPLNERIVGGSDPATAGSVTVTRRMSYESAGGALFIVFDIMNEGDTPVSSGGYSSTYVGSDGRQVSASGNALTNDVAPGAIATDVVVFEGADPGGTVHFIVYNEGFNEVPFDFNS